jgi:drug/metabolite transporter (DMT)-like permease
MGVLNYPEPLVGVTLGSFAALLFVTLLLIKEKKVPTLFLSDAKRVFIKLYPRWYFCTSLALYSFFYALKSIPVAIANSIESTEPMFIFLISYLFLQKEEVITPAVVLSSAAIMAGVVMIILF